MIDTSGVVVGGGAVAAADHMTHDIASGESRKNPIHATAGKWASSDPLEKNEQYMRGGVLLLALLLALFGAAATWSVFF